MVSLTRDSAASVKLDMARGLAALMVFFGHAVGIFLRNPTDEGAPVGPQHVWKYLFAFGHEAVMVFFVLSGYLVGSSVIKAVESGRWTWGAYATTRLTRLYIVLLPALLFGLGLDLAGISLFGPASIYGGGARYHGIIENVADWVSGEVFFGNLLFVQYILVHTLGSNGPLWSLSYEFWYYVAFPLFWLGTRRQSSWAIRILFILLGVGVLVFIGRHGAIRFGVWMFGIAIALAPPLPRLGSRAAGWASLIGLVGSAVASRAGIGPMAFDFVKDILVGIMFSIWMLHVLNAPAHPIGVRQRTFAQRISGMSYTLYLCHLPFLVFLHAWLIGSGPLWDSDVAGFLKLAAVLAVCLAYVGLVWWLFEARTEALRKWLKTRFGEPRPESVSV